MADGRWPMADGRCRIPLFVEEDMALPYRLTLDPTRILLRKYCHFCTNLSALLVFDRKVTKPE
jgi:hypothetical protein